MSDVLVLERPKSKEKKKAGKVKSVLRVLRGGLWVGDVLLDRKGRVWRHVPSIPADVVLKAMAAFTRGEERGEVVGRRDGLSYEWAEVVEPVVTKAAEGAAELAEAA
jgi:hypothetical protein